MIETTDERGALVFVREDVLLEVEEQSGKPFMQVLRDVLCGARDRLEELCLLHGPTEAHRRLKAEFGWTTATPAPPPDRHYDLQRNLHILQQWSRTPRHADDLAELRRLLSLDAVPAEVLAMRIIRFIAKFQISHRELREEIEFTEPRSELTAAVLRHCRI